MNSQLTHAQFSSQEVQEMEEAARHGYNDVCSEVTQSFDQSAASGYDTTTQNQYIMDDDGDGGGGDNDAELHEALDKSAASVDASNETAFDSSVQDETTFDTSVQDETTFDTSVQDETAFDSSVQEEAVCVSPKCDVCMRKFISKEKLIEHRRVEHGSIPTFKCSLCPKFFQEEDEITTHLRQAHDVTGATYECDV